MTLYENKRTITEFEERTGGKSEERIQTGPLLINEEQVTRTAGGASGQRLEGNLTNEKNKLCKTREEKTQIHQKRFYILSLLQKHLVTFPGWRLSVSSLNNASV